MSSVSYDSLSSAAEIIPQAKDNKIFVLNQFSGSSIKQKVNSKICSFNVKLYKQAIKTKLPTENRVQSEERNNLSGKKNCHLVKVGERRSPDEPKWGLPTLESSGWWQFLQGFT